MFEEACIIYILFCGRSLQSSSISSTSDTPAKQNPCPRPSFFCGYLFDNNNRTNFAIMTTNNPPASPDDDCHFGPANPLGPIDRDAATSNGNTTKTTSTTPIAHHDSLEDLEAADGESEHDQSDGDQENDSDGIQSTKFHHTTVWTTVLPSGQAFRTTRTLLLVHAPHQTARLLALAIAKRIIKHLIVELRPRRSQPCMRHPRHWDRPTASSSTIISHTMDPTPEQPSTFVPMAVAPPSSDRSSTELVSVKAEKK